MGWTHREVPVTHGLVAESDGLEGGSVGDDLHTGACLQLSLVRQIERNTCGTKGYQRPLINTQPASDLNTHHLQKPYSLENEEAALEIFRVFDMNYLPLGLSMIDN